MLAWLQKLKQSEDVKKLLGNELKDVKEHNQLLLQQAGVMESETGMLKEEVAASNKVY